jgi:hypothetical protein
MEKEMPTMTQLNEMAAALSPAPRYLHDCECCRFVGFHKDADLYYCATEPTVIARYSDEGSDYSSGLVFANGANEALTIARRRAVALDLI